MCVCTVNSMLDEITKFKQEYKKTNQETKINHKSNIWQNIRKSIQRQFLTVAKNIFLVVHNEFIDKEFVPFANTNAETLEDLEPFKAWILDRKQKIFDKFKIVTKDIFHLSSALNNDKVCMIPGQAANYSLQTEYKPVDFTKPSEEKVFLTQYLKLLTNTFTKEKKNKAAERKPKTHNKATTKKDNEKSKDTNPSISSSSDNNKAITTSKPEEEKDNKSLTVTQNADSEKIIEDITIARKTSPIFNVNIIELTTANIKHLVVPMIRELLFGVDSKHVLVLSAYSRVTSLKNPTIPHDLLYLFKYNYARIIKENHEINNYEKEFFVKCYKSFYEDIKTEASKHLTFRIITKSKNLKWYDRYHNIPPNGFCAYLATHYLSLRYQKICELERNANNNECYKHIKIEDICPLVWNVEDADERKAFKAHLATLLTHLENNNTEEDIDTSLV